MAQFDDVFEAPLPDAFPGDRMRFMEHQLQYLYSEVTHLRGVQNQAPPPQPRPNPNLSPPSKFYGTPSDLPMFKLRLYQYIMGNYNTYGDNATQILVELNQAAAASSRSQGSSNPPPRTPPGYP